MRRLPIALIFAAVIVLTVTVTIHYTPPQTNKTITVFVRGSGSYWTLFIEYNTSLPPPLIIINTNPPTEIAYYPNIVYSDLGAVYVVTSFNGSAIVYKLSQLPRVEGLDRLVIDLNTASAT